MQHGDWSFLEKYHRPLFVFLKKRIALVEEFTV